MHKISSSLFLQIWDIEKNENIATYVTPNFDSLLTILWSPMDKDLMISTAKDQTLNLWKISDYPPKDETGNLLKFMCVLFQ